MKQRPWKRALSLMLAFALVFAMPCVTGVYAAGAAMAAASTSTARPCRSR